MNQYNKHDQKHGKWIYYYACSKNISAICNYFNGDCHGKYSYYTPNGNLCYTGCYYYNKATGLWRYFDDKNKEYENIFYII